MVFVMVVFIVGWILPLQAREREEWTSFPQYERERPGRDDYFRADLQRPGDEPVLLYTAWGTSLESYLKKAGYSDSEIYRIDLALFQGWGTSSPKDYVENLRQTIQTMREDHGRDVDIIAHSLGGLTARWYLEMEDGAQYVDDLVTIATPHQGGYVFYAFYLTPAGRTMVPRSSFLRKINSNPLAPSVEYTAVWSGIDEVFLFNIFGTRGAQLPENLVEQHGNSRNILGGYTEHIELAVSWDAFKKYLPHLD